MTDTRPGAIELMYMALMQIGFYSGKQTYNVSPLERLSRIDRIASNTLREMNTRHTKAVQRFMFQRKEG